MLSPARPHPGEPGYEARQRRYEQDREALRRHPENWGFVQPDETPAAAPPAPPEKSGKTGDNARRKHRR